MEAEALRIIGGEVDEAPSAVACAIAAASFGLSESFTSGSVCVLASTFCNDCHSAVAAAADALLALLLVASVAAVAVAVARCPPAILCMAALKRPTGRYQ